MRYKAIAFTIVFVFSFLIINQSFDDFDNSSESKTITKPQTDKKELLNSISQWSDRKKKIKGVAKFDEPNKFNELHRLLRTRDGEESPSYKMNYKIDELKKAKAKVSKLNKGAAEVTWIERGPANVGGRTRGILVDPDDPNKDTWFACSVGGGVWKTTDAGTTWELKTAGLPNIAMSYIAMAESNHNVIYVGTGEGFGNVDGIVGNGIFKSTDKGETWVQLSSTANNTDFSFVNRIVVDPADENIVIAATNGGVFKSTDGGIGWTETYTSSNVQDLIMNPLNSKSLYAAKNGGPVLKSLDGGDSWIEIREGVNAGARIEIDIAPSDTNRLYITAQEGIFLMSSDAGLTWEEVNDLSGENINWHNGQGGYDNAIAVHPYNEDVVYYGGIAVFKAEMVFDSVKGISSVDTIGTSTFMAFKNDNLSYMDGGVGTGEEYFEEDLVIDDDYVDVEIRFGNSITQKAYMFINYTQYVSMIDVPFQVWDVSNNKQLTVAYNDIRKNNGYDWSFTRGDEIFVLAVDYDAVSVDPNIATADGLKYKNIYVVSPKIASGSTWDPAAHPESSLNITAGFVPIVNRNSTQLTNWYDRYIGEHAAVHVDQHELVMVPMNESTGEFRILNGNDGGVAFSNDGGVNWIETDQNGYNTTQFYGADKKPGASEYFGGTQDNGTWYSAPGIDATASTAYNFAIGGDGFETAWSYGDPNKLIGGSQYNRFWKTVDGGANWYPADDGFTGWGNSAESPFVSKLAKNNSDPDLLFTITRAGVWRSDDFGDKWALSPINNLDAGGAWFSWAQVSISIADPQVVWAASYLNSTVPNVSKDGGFTFSTTSGYDDVTMGLISGLDTDPIDPATAYLTFSFSDAPKILRTTDYGQTWTDISGFGTGDESTTGFPDVAVFSVVVMPYNTDIIWAGTDIGIVESLDNGATWHLLESNLPSVSIWEIKIVDDQVVLATHGRGIWSATLAELSGYTPPVVTLGPVINGDIRVGTDGVTIFASLRSVYDSTHVIVDGEPIRTILNTEIEDITVTTVISEVGTKNIYLRSYKDGESFRSASFDVFVFEVLAAEDGYYSGFSAGEDGFVLDGFEILETAGFTSSALQSPHDYAAKTDYLAVLRTPIIVAGTDAIMTYKDVAIIETGTAGTVFGDLEFWDYVIVEASQGGEWMPLADGYDASSDSRWLTAYDNVQSGDESMFKSHTINLLDNFNAGDTVLIRFRLFSDDNTVGWGWLIDDLIIQGQFVGVENEVQVPVKYALNQNYPNPFNPSTTISFALPQKSDVSIKVFNNIGQLVETLYKAETNPGYHNVTWNAKVASGIYYFSIKAGDFVETKKMVLLK